MAINLVTRDEWKARPPRGAYSDLPSTKGVKVHYTGSRENPRMLDDHDLCVARVRAIQQQHQDGNKWIDIGYSLVACPHRKVFVGRGAHHLPAANGPDLNSGHYAILALVGNAGLVEPTDDLLLGIWDGIEYLRKHGGAGHEIKGHRDGYSTDCPGPELYAWVKRGAPRPGGSTPKPEPKPGKTPAWPGRLLTYPPLMSGEDVKAWQAQMKRRGWDITVDGDFGPRSREVCLAFQREKDLSTDGVVGRETWQAAFELPIT